MSKHVHFADDPKVPALTPKVVTSSWGLSWGVIALIIIVMAIVGFLVWKYYFKKKEPSSEE